MEILPVHPEIANYLKKRNLERKFAKQIGLVESSLRHPSLEVELLEPKNLKFFSFRVDRKYRAVFIFHNPNKIEIIDVNNHYR